MPKSKPKKLPRFKSLDQLVEFFDAYDMGDYWDEMPEAHFEVNIKKKAHFIALETDLADELTKIARSKKISSAGLVNSWIREKILAHG